MYEREWCQWKWLNALCCGASLQMNWTKGLFLCCTSVGNWIAYNEITFFWSPAKGAGYVRKRKVLMSVRPCPFLWNSWKVSWITFLSSSSRMKGASCTPNLTGKEMQGRGNWVFWRSSEKKRLMQNIKEGWYELPCNKMEWILSKMIGRKRVLTRPMSLKTAL